eukprot:363801-Chlamydomonas_euryale.AAC.2
MMCRQPAMASLRKLPHMGSGMGMRSCMGTRADVLPSRALLIRHEAGVASNGMRQPQDATMRSSMCQPRGATARVTAGGRGGGSSAADGAAQRVVAGGRGGGSNAVDGSAVRMVAGGRGGGSSAADGAAVRVVAGGRGGGSNAVDGSPHPMRWDEQQGTGLAKVPNAMSPHALHVKCCMFGAACGMFGAGCGMFGAACGMFGAACGMFGAACCMFGAAC